jgi:hypothetical protein
MVHETGRNMGVWRRHPEPHPFQWHSGPHLVFCSCGFTWSQILSPCSSTKYCRVWNNNILFYINEYIFSSMSLISCSGTYNKLCYVSRCFWSLREVWNVAVPSAEIKPSSTYIRCYTSPLSWSFDTILHSLLNCWSQNVIFFLSETGVPEGAESICSKACCTLA